MDIVTYLHRKYYPSEQIKPIRWVADIVFELYTGERRILYSNKPISIAKHLQKREQMKAGTKYGIIKIIKKPIYV